VTQVLLVLKVYKVQEDQKEIKVLLDLKVHKVVVVLLELQEHQVL
jgi:hypothetical protein